MRPVRFQVLGRSRTLRFLRLKIRTHFAQGRRACSLSLQPDKPRLPCAASRVPASPAHAAPTGAHGVCRVHAGRCAAGVLPASSDCGTRAGQRRHNLVCRTWLSSCLNPTDCSKTKNGGHFASPKKEKSGFKPFCLVRSINRANRSNDYGASAACSCRWSLSACHGDCPSSESAEQANTQWLFGQ
jgi:hypothetical protein